MRINNANEMNVKSQTNKKNEWVTPFFAGFKVTILCYEMFTKVSKLSYMWRLAGGFLFSFQSNSDK